MNNHNTGFEEILGGRYKVIGGRLGVGNFGEVRLGLDTKTKTRSQKFVQKTQQKTPFCRVAVKIERPIKKKSKNAITQLQNEYNILSILNRDGNQTFIESTIIHEAGLRRSHWCPPCPLLWSVWQDSVSCDAGAGT